MDKDEYQSFLEFQKWKKLQMENKNKSLSEKQKEKSQSVVHNKHKINESLGDYWNEDRSFHYDYDDEDNYYGENEMYDYGIEDEFEIDDRLTPTKTQYAVAKGGKVISDNDLSKQADDVLSLKIKVEVQEALFKILKDYVRKDEIDLYLSKNRPNSNFKQKDYNHHEGHCDEDDYDDYDDEDKEDKYDSYKDSLDDESAVNIREKAFTKVANKLKEKEEKNKSSELVPKEWKLASQKLDEVISVEVPIAGSDQMMGSTGIDDDSWLEDAIQ